jgi:RimJ/RimL family protein N-acetyltransferase
MAAGVERLGPRLWRGTDKTGRPYRLREIRPTDAPALQRAFAEQEPTDRKLRLLSAIPRLPDRLAEKFCTVDGVRDFALVWVPEDDPDTLCGGARLMRDADDESAEFAVTVASRLKGHGLGRKALETVLELGAENGVKRVWGSISTANAPMRALARKLGMTQRPDPEEFSLVIAEKAL